MISWQRMRSRDFQQFLKLKKTKLTQRIGCTLSSDKNGYSLNKLQHLANLVTGWGTTDFTHLSWPSPWHRHFYLFSFLSQTPPPHTHRSSLCQCPSHDIEQSVWHDCLPPLSPFTPPALTQLGDVVLQLWSRVQQGHQDVWKHQSRTVKKVSFVIAQTHYYEHCLHTYLRRNGHAISDGILRAVYSPHTHISKALNEKLLHTASSFKSIYTDLRRPLGRGVNSQIIYEYMSLP